MVVGGGHRVKRDCEGRATVLNVHVQRVPLGWEG